MLALRGRTEKQDVSVPNILPCRIHASGPTRVTKRFWSPAKENDGTKTSYFRGRRLRGKTLRLPLGYIGVAAKATERALFQQQSQPNDEPQIQSSAADTEDDEPDHKPEAIKTLEPIATFNEVIVWGHDMLPAADDPFVKGIEEWIAFAEAIHDQPVTLESHSDLTDSGRYPGA